MKVRAIQHRHIVQLDALLAKLQRALRHKGRLFVGGAAHHFRGLLARGAAGGQFLGELPRVRRDGRVGDVEYFRCAAIIRFDFVNLRAGITLGELHNVRVVRAAPRVDALRIITHHHHVFVARTEQINQLRLQQIRILIFVHQHKLKPLLIHRANVLVLLHQPQPQHQQIIKIH